MPTETLSVPKAARCKNCGYSLRGLYDPRCPECGALFDPDDPTTYTVRHARRLVDNRWIPLFSCCILGVVGCLLLRIPVQLLVLFPGWLWSDSLFRRHRAVWLALTICAFVMILAHPVRPSRLTACITILGSVGWFLLALASLVVVAGASV